MNVMTEAHAGMQLYTAEHTGMRAPKHLQQGMHGWKTLHLTVLLCLGPCCWTPHGRHGRATSASSRQVGHNALLKTRGLG